MTVNCAKKFDDFIHYKCYKIPESALAPHNFANSETGPEFQAQGTAAVPPSSEPWHYATMPNSQHRAAINATAPIVPKGDQDFGGCAGRAYTPTFFVGTPCPVGVLWVVATVAEIPAVPGRGICRAGLVPDGEEYFRAIVSSLLFLFDTRGERVLPTVPARFRATPFRWGQVSGSRRHVMLPED